MPCTTITSQAVPPGAGAADSCNAAERFKAAMQAAPEGADLYVDAPTRGGNPLGDVMKAFESLDLQPPGSTTGDPATAQDGEEMSDADRFASFGQEMLAVQSEILRTVLMMETMNSAKQGVTTLFQQQG